MQFNQNSTDIKGPEWFPYVQGSILLDSFTKCALGEMVQTVGQATGWVKVGVRQIPVRGGTYVVEVYDQGGAVPPNGNQQVAVPNEDVSGTGTTVTTWCDQAVGTSNIFQSIDDGLSPNTSDYIRTGTNGPGGPGRYVSRFNTGSLTLTGKRILAVRLVLVIAGTTSGTWSAGLNLGGVDYSALSNIPIIPSGVNVADMTYTKEWNINPSTGLPWTIAQVQALDTTDEWWVESTLAVGGVTILFNCYLMVIYADENRLAVGLLDDRASALSPNLYNIVPLLTPTGGTWTKDGTGMHLYGIRRTSDSGALQIATLDSGKVLSVARSSTPTLDPTYGYIPFTSDLTPQSPALALVQVTTAPADSVDSQPYLKLVESQVFSGQDAEQEFSGAAVANYKFVKFVAKPGAATAAMLIKLKRRSDNVQLGGTATLPTSLAVGGDVVSVTPVAGGLYLIMVALSSAATLATATQYYIEFSSATASGAPWVVIAGDTTQHGDAASFGGTTDRGLVNGSEADRYDVFTTIGLSSVVAPGSFAGVAQTQPISGSTVCGVATIGRAHLSWTATSLAANFGYYDLQRSDDGGTTYTTIGYLLTESLVAFDDYEALRNVATKYRIKVVRLDGLPSDYTAVATVTVPETCAEIIFVSNYDPTTNIAYDRRPQADYDVLDSGAAITVPIYGRDRQLGFQPTERLGVTARFTVLVGIDSRVPAGGGLSVNAFAPLRAIAVAPLPYVCVLDRWGTRLMAQLRVPDASHTEPLGQYAASIEATEVTTTPFAVSVT